MLTFKKIKRKPTYVDMAEVNGKMAKEILKNGYSGRSVSFSKEDEKLVLNSKDDEIVGLIATDGDSYWFINYKFAKENYEI